MFRKNARQRGTISSGGKADPWCRAIETKGHSGRARSESVDACSRAITQFFFFRVRYDGCVD